MFIDDYYSIYTRQKHFHIHTGVSLGQISLAAYLRSHIQNISPVDRKDLNAIVHATDLNPRDDIVNPYHGPLKDPQCRHENELKYDPYAEQKLSNILQTHPDLKQRITPYIDPFSYRTEPNNEVEQLKKRVQHLMNQNSELTKRNFEIETERNQLLIELKKTDNSLIDQTLLCEKYKLRCESLLLYPHTIEEFKEDPTDESPKPYFIPDRYFDYRPDLDGYTEYADKVSRYIGNGKSKLS